MNGLGPNEAAVVVPVVAILAITFLGMLRILQRGSRKAGVASSEETQLLQELHRGFERLEQRVEALETLLLEKSVGAPSRTEV